jgi:hypothetical protein
MVVIPTSTHVHLHYGNTSVEYIAYLLTLVGIALTIFLARRPPVRMPEPMPAGGDLLSRIIEGPSSDEQESASIDGHDAPPLEARERSPFDAREPSPSDEEGPSSG